MHLHDMWCNAFHCYDNHVGERSRQKKRMRIIKGLMKRWEVEMR